MGFLHNACLHRSDWFHLEIANQSKQFSSESHLQIQALYPLLGEHRCMIDHQGLGLNLRFCLSVGNKGQDSPLFSILCRTFYIMALCVCVCMCALVRKSADFTNIIAGCLTLRINGRHTTPTVINYITTTTVVNNNTTTAITTHKCTPGRNIPVLLSPPIFCTTSLAGMDLRHLHISQGSSSSPCDSHGSPWRSGLSKSLSRVIQLVKRGGMEME